MTFSRLKVGIHRLKNVMHFGRIRFEAILLVRLLLAQQRREKLHRFYGHHSAARISARHRHTRRAREVPEAPIEDEPGEPLLVVAALPECPILGVELLAAAPPMQLLYIGARHHVVVDRLAGRFGKPVNGKAAQRRHPPVLTRTMYFRFHE